MGEEKDNSGQQEMQSGASDSPSGGAGGADNLCVPPKIEEKHRDTYILMRLDPQPHPVFFVINAKVYDSTPKELQVIGSPERDELNEFHYGENTCPVNFIRIPAIIQLTPDEVHKCDEDPHELFTYVGEIPAEAADGKVWDGSKGDGTTWLQAFGVEY